MEDKSKAPKEKSLSDAAYEQMSGIAPELDIGLPEDGEEEAEHKTLKESMETSHLTDTQTALMQLNPDLGWPHLNTLQVARIFPDTYNPLFKILVKDLIRRAKGLLSVAECLAIVTTAMSIAIDGEGRIDIITVMGAIQKETERKEAEKNPLGI